MPSLEIVFRLVTGLGDVAFGIDMACIRLGSEQTQNPCPLFLGELTLQVSTAERHQAFVTEPEALEETLPSWGRERIQRRRFVRGQVGLEFSPRADELASALGGRF